MRRLILSIALLGVTTMASFVLSGSMAHASEPIDVKRARNTSRTDAEILDALYKTVPADKVDVREMFLTFGVTYKDIGDFKQDLIRRTEERGVRHAKRLLKRYYGLIWNYEEEKNAGIICMFNKTYYYHAAILSKALEIIKSDTKRAENFSEEAQQFYSKCQNVFPESDRLKFKRELGLMTKEEMEKQDQQWASLLVVDGKVRLRSRNEALLKAAIVVANADPSVHTFDASEEVINDDSLAILLDGLDGNQRIQCIDLYYNFITNVSLARIHTFVTDNVNLLKMDLSSNHLDYEQVRPILEILEQRQKFEVEGEPVNEK